MDRADAAVAATRDRYTDLEPRLRGRRLGCADAAGAVMLPARSFDLVTMRLVPAFPRTRRPWWRGYGGCRRPAGCGRLVTTSLTGRLPEERRSIPLTPEAWPR